jgi:uncharacterized protein (DUF885 family)
MINDLIDSFFAERWEEFPEEASSLGVDGYDHRLGEYSAAAFARRDAQADAWLTRFEAVPTDDLTPEEQIDRALLLSELQGDIARRDWQVWKRNPDVYLWPGLGAIFKMFLYRSLPEQELAAAAAARLDQVPAILEDGKRNLDAAMASPLFVERSLGMCKAAAHYARALVPAEVSDPDARDRVAEAGERAARAYDDFGEYLEKLRANASGSYAIGEELYSALLREVEGLDYGASEMRERGRAEFERLSAEMGARAAALKGTDDWVEVIRELNKDHPATPEEMRELYEDWTERARAFCAERDLVTFLDGEQCNVVPSPPFQRPVLAVASYSGPPPLTEGLVGHFFVPYPPDGTPEDEIQQRLESNSRISIPTVSVHEAYPGHHWHLITMGANPRIARKALGSSYFAEGWALYTEMMMLEEGFYGDPAHELGVFDARIFRAARIIVDTSLHIGDMTYEEAVSFMMDRTGMSESTARAEVGRYCTWPTQASSYLTGCLEIERMRASWKGSLKSFHDTLCRAGSLPIGLAERALGMERALGT